VALSAKLKGIVGSKQPYNLAIVRDFIETLECHYPEISAKLGLNQEQLGLKPISDRGIGPNKLELIAKYPEWKAILQDPPTKIKELVTKKDIQTLGAILDAVNDHEVIEIAIKNLSQDFSSDRHFQAQVLGLIDALIEKGDEFTLQTLASYSFSQPHVQKLVAENSIWKAFSEAITIKDQARRIKYLDEHLHLKAKDSCSPDKALSQEEAVRLHDQAKPVLEMVR
jgi:hypothetical protein